MRISNRVSDLLRSAALPLDSGKAFPMRSSAELCLGDAISLFDKGNFVDAARRAVDSLSYSVGVFSPVYTSAKAALGEMSA